MIRQKFHDGIEDCICYTSLLTLLLIFQPLILKWRFVQNQQNLEQISGFWPLKNILASSILIELTHIWFNLSPDSLLLRWGFLRRSVLIMFHFITVLDISPKKGVKLLDFFFSKADKDRVDFDGLWPQYSL